MLTTYNYLDEPKQGCFPYYNWYVVQLYVITVIFTESLLPYYIYVEELWQSTGNVCFYPHKKDRYLIMVLN